MGRQLFSSQQRAAFNGWQCSTIDPTAFRPLFGCHAALQSQTAVTAYFKSKYLPHFGCAKRYSFLSFSHLKWTFKREISLQIKSTSVGVRFFRLLHALLCICVAMPNYLTIIQCCDCRLETHLFGSSPKRVRIRSEHPQFLPSFPRSVLLANLILSNTPGPIHSPRENLPNQLKTMTCSRMGHCVAWHLKKWHFCLMVTPVTTKHLYNIYTMLAQRRRRWANVV